MGENGVDKPLVFVSYSKHDRAWKDDYLLVHLYGLEAAELLTVWNDDDIDSGGKWFPPLVKAMHEAHVAVCLISPHYLRTKFILDEEIPYLLQRSETEGLHLKFMLVEPCAWQAHRWLSDRQMFLKKGACVRTDYAGREHLPFAMLAEHLLELLPEAAPIEAENSLPVSPRIKAALTKMKADNEATIANFSATEVALAREAIKVTLESCRICDKPLASNLKQCIHCGAGYPINCLVDIERLPVTGAELFGRQAELAMLDEAWQSEKTNIVALVAWGGVGKSTLLNKWVESLAADNYRGARRTFGWSFYSQGTNERVTSADAFIDAALRFFGDPEPEAGSPWSKGERLAELVGREKALLLLDGMEPLQDQYQGMKDPALARLIECLAVRNEGLCVITTREPVNELADFAETTLQKNLEFLSPEAGRALLRVKGIRGSDAELEAASAAFGNHALAINLLANYLRDCEERHIRHAEQIPDLADLDDPNHRHPRRVMAAFAKRFGDGPELDLLHMMGLFDRPADAGCIQALRSEPAIPGLTDKLSVLDEASWFRLLSNLRELGLIAPASHHDANELDAHPLVREHFGAALRAQRPEAWQAGHFRLYERLKVVPKKHQPDTLDEMAPLFQAIHHGCQAGQHRTTYSDVYRARIHKGRNFLVKELGAHGSDLGALSSFFEHSWLKPTLSLGEDVRSWLHINVGHNLRALGRSEEAFHSFQEGMTLALAINRLDRTTSCASNISNTYWITGQLAEAIRYGNLGVKYADLGDNMFWKKTSRSVLAGAHHQMAERKSALRLLEEADAVSDPDEKGRPNPNASLSYNYCDLLIDLNRLNDAEERANTTLQQGLTKKWIVEIALSYVGLGVIAFRRHDFAKALIELDNAVDWLRRLGAVDNTPRGLLARAALFRSMEVYDRSQRDLDEVMRLAKRCGMRLHECDAYLEYARLALAEGRLDAARTHFRSAAGLVRICGYHRRSNDVQQLQAALA